MSEINFELTSSGGDEVAASLEDIRVKEYLAGEETKRFAGELKKLKETGTATAEQIESATRQIVRSQQAHREASAEVRGLSAASADVAIKVQDVAARLGAISQAASQFGSVLRSIDPDLAALGDALGTVGQAAGAGGAAFGPWGAVIGGAIGAVQALVQHLHEEEEAHHAVAAAIRAQTTDLDLLQERMGAQDRIQRLHEGLGTVEEQTRALTAAESELDAEHERLRSTQERLADATRRRANIEGLLTGAMGGGREATARLQTQYDALGETIQSLNADVRGFTVSLETQQQNTIELASGLFEAQNRARDEAEEARRRSRHGPGDDIDGAYRRIDDAIASALERQRVAYEEQKRLIRQHAEDVEAAEVAKTDAHKRELRKREEAELAHADKVRQAQIEAAEEAKRLLEKQEANAAEAFQKTKDEAEGVLGPAIDGLTGALSSVIAGTESADEAFQGLLASFLEMLSQKAALEAAGQFASAIASFASQDYGGGALHLAAGVAWTAVAVASGAASIAVAPPAAATPASPQQSAPAESGGGGNVVINMNGNMVTASTHAEVGREVSHALAADTRRFGAGRR